MNPARSLALVTLLSTLALPVNAQDQTASQRTDTRSEPVPRNAFYVELGGNALIYSLNVDRLVTRHVSLRGGVMLLPDLFSGQGGLVTAAPLSINYLIGTGGHYVEAGLGLVLGVGSRSGGEIDFVDGASPTMTLGYRYLRGHRILRAGFTPVFQTHARPPLRYRGIDGHDYTFPGTGGRPWQTSFGFSVGRTF